MGEGEMEEMAARGHEGGEGEGHRETWGGERGCMGRGKDTEEKEDTVRGEISRRGGLRGPGLTCRVFWFSILVLTSG